MRRPRCSAVSWSSPWSTAGRRPCASNPRATCAPSCSSPSGRSRHRPCAPPCRMRCRIATRSTTSAAWRWRWLAWRLGARGPPRRDRGPDPRAVSGRGLPGAAQADGGGSGGRGPRCLPLGGRFDGHRVRRFGPRPDTDRGRFPGHRGRARPAGHGAGRPPALGRGSDHRGQLARARQLGQGLDSSTKAPTAATRAGSGDCPPACELHPSGTVQSAACRQARRPEIRRLVARRRRPHPARRAAHRARARHRHRPRGRGQRDGRHDRPPARRSRRPSPTSPTRARWTCCWRPGEHMSGTLVAMALHALGRARHLADRRPGRHPHRFQPRPGAHRQRRPGPRTPTRSAAGEGRHRGRLPGRHRRVAT